MQVWALRAGILASCGSLDLHYTIFRKRWGVHARDSSVRGKEVFVSMSTCCMKMKCHFVPGVSKSCKGKLIRCAAGLSQKHCKKKDTHNQLLSTRLVVNLLWIPKLMIIFRSEIEWRIRESIYHIYKRNLCVKQADSCENKQEDVFFLRCTSW